MIILHEQILTHLANKMRDEFQKGFDYNEIEVYIESIDEIGINTIKGLCNINIILYGTYVYNEGFKHNCFDLEISIFDSLDNEINFTLDINYDELINKLTKTLYEE